MTYTIASPATTPFDLRELAPRERHARVFSRFDALQSGEAMQVLIDHDAQPLRAEFDSRRFAQFEWAVLDAGPSLWHVQITRIGAGTVASAGGSCCSGGACCG
jgi:uncharacterized protein (DUF2249 family)